LKGRIFEGGCKGGVYAVVHVEIGKEEGADEKKEKQCLCLRIFEEVFYPSLQQFIVS